MWKRGNNLPYSYKDIVAIGTGIVYKTFVIHEYPKNNVTATTSRTTPQCTKVNELEISKCNTESRINHHKNPNTHSHYLRCCIPRYYT